MFVHFLCPRQIFPMLYTRQAIRFIIRARFHLSVILLDIQTIAAQIHVTFGLYFSIRYHTFELQCLTTWMHTYRSDSDTHMHSHTGRIINHGSCRKCDQFVEREKKPSNNEINTRRLFIYSPVHSFIHSLLTYTCLQSFHFNRCSHCGTLASQMFKFNTCLANLWSSW